MVSRSPALTPLGFRRELTIFLSIVVGFLVFIVLLLVILLQLLSARQEDATLRQWDATADAAAERLERETATGDLETWLVYLRTTWDIAAAELRTPEGRIVRSGEPASELHRVERRIGAGQLILYFDAAPLRSTQRLFRLTAIGAFAATVITTILFALFLPRIIRPFESMLRSAREVEPAGTGDEAAYLVDTFRRTIDRLRKQEVELHRLHELEKTRADELERIVSTLKRSLASGFLALDPNGRIVEINDAGRRILDVDYDRTFTGSRPADVIGDNALARLLDEAGRNRTPIQRQEVTFPARDKELTIGLTQVPLFDDSGTYLGALTLFTDLTEMRVLEDRLRATQTLADLGQIAAGIAHEFRNSLSTIRGYLRLAAAEGEPGRIHHRIEAADREAVELSTAIDRLLAFARPVEPQWEPVNLGDLVRAVADRLHDTDEAQFDLELDSGVQIEGDPSLLARAMENLMRNAVESNRLAGRGEVPVAVGLEPGRVPVLTIRDEGVGLAPGEAEKIVLPFQSKKPGGWGLGLPLARRILLAHGADFEITGTEDGGASVRVAFNRNAADSATDEVSRKVSDSHAHSTARNHPEIS